MRVNATHITVGHEVYDVASASWRLQTVSFAINSNLQLLEDLVSFQRATRKDLNLANLDPDPDPDPDPWAGLLPGWWC